MFPETLLADAHRHLEIPLLGFYPSHGFVERLATELGHGWHYLMNQVQSATSDEELMKRRHRTVNVMTSGKFKFMPPEEKRLPSTPLGIYFAHMTNLGPLTPCSKSNVWQLARQAETPVCAENCSYNLFGQHPIRARHSEAAPFKSPRPEVERKRRLVRADNRYTAT